MLLFATCFRVDLEAHFSLSKSFMTAERSQGPSRAHEMRRDAFDSGGDDGYDICASKLNCLTTFIDTDNKGGCLHLCGTFASFK